MFSKDMNRVDIVLVTSDIYDKFSASVFGFILENTESKREAEEYLIRVFVEVSKVIETKENINLIYLLKIASKMIFDKKKSSIKFGGREIYPNISIKISN